MVERAKENKSEFNLIQPCFFVGVDYTVGRAKENNSIRFNHVLDEWVDVSNGWIGQ